LPACRQCGTKTSSFSFGEQSDYCSTCRAQQPARAKADLMQDVPEAVSDDWFKATQVLIAMNCFVFALMLANGISPVDPTTDDLIRWGANFGPLTLGGQYWRTLSAGFLHIGIVHILFNMWCLWSLGNLAERLLGGFNTFAIYLITGFGASLLSLCWDPFRVSAGASGPIFGIAGVLIAVLYYGKFNIPPSKVRYLLGYVTRFALMNLILGLRSNTDNMAHLGGLVSGLFIGLFIARSLTADPSQRVQRERFVLLAAAVVLIAIFVPVKKAKGFASELYLGRDAIEKNDYNSAIVHFQRFTSENDSNPQGHEQLGFCYHSLKRYDEAEREYKRALVLHPDSPFPEMNLGEIYILQGKPEQAVPLIKKALSKIDPDSEDYKMYAGALLATNDYPEAEKALRASLKLDDKDPDTHLKLSEVLVAEKKTGEAQSERKLAGELAKKSESAK
jgi:rhomboid protease GluP